MQFLADGLQTLLKMRYITGTFLGMFRNFQGIYSGQYLHYLSSCNEEKKVLIKGNTITDDYPIINSISKIVYIIPVSNAWPEGGGRVVKIIKINKKIL